MTGQSRACLGALLRTAETPKAEMVTALLDMCRKNGIRVGTLLLDREFYSTEIMNQLDARDITWLMPAVKNGAIKEEIAKFERGERGPVSIHSIRSSKILAEFTVPEATIIILTADCPGAPCPQARPHIAGSCSQTNSRDPANYTLHSYCVTCFITNRRC